MFFMSLILAVIKLVQLSQFLRHLVLAFYSFYNTRVCGIIKQRKKAAKNQIKMVNILDLAY